VVASNNLGSVFVAQGKSAEAILQFRKTIRLDRTCIKAHINLGQVLLDQGDLTGARASFTQALQLDPSQPDAHERLALAWALANDWEKATSCLHQAVHLRPGVPTFRRELGCALWHLGRRAEARAEYQKSLQLDPRWPEMVARTAWGLAVDPNPRSRNGRIALLLALQVHHVLGEQCPEALDLLGAAYAELGDFEKARKAAHRAHEQAVTLGKTTLAAEIKGRIQGYKNGQAFRAAR
jgi:Flp pilus assembly protein TadD